MNRFQLAWNHLFNVVFDRLGEPKTVESMGVFLDLVEAQIPLPPVERSNETYLFTCDFCASDEPLRFGQKFCGECGHAVDWSDYL